MTFDEWYTTNKDEVRRLATQEGLAPMSQFIWRACKQQDMTVTCSQIELIHRLPELKVKPFPIDLRPPEETVELLGAERALLLFMYAHHEHLREHNEVLTTFARAYSSLREILIKEVS